MKVAVGFSPRGGAQPRGVAERRLPLPRRVTVQPSLRDGIFPGGRFRGLKSTAAIVQSLRDVKPMRPFGSYQKQRGAIPGFGVFSGL